ncbi:MAG: hypothetical protein NTZ05_14875, partial [Chloroflexi bacterium]|nr:hypothetical protein [Chloroflexota bacterium]
SKGVRNVQGIQDAELDKLIEQQAAEFNPEKRRKLLQDIQLRLLDNVYGIGVYALLTYEGVHPWVKNFYLSPARPTDRVVRTVWLDQTKKKR